MRNLATLEFVDQSTSDKGVVIVRMSEEAVGIALSLAKDGDIEVWLSGADMERLLHSLHAAMDEFQHDRS